MTDTQTRTYQGTGYPPKTGRAGLCPRSGVRLAALVMLLAAAWPGLVRSQDQAGTVPSRQAPGEYITKMDTVISLRLNFNNEYDQFMLQGAGQRYDIRPSLFVSNRLSVNYRFISLGLGFTLRFLPGNDGNDMRGSTRSFYLRMNLFLNRWFQELQYGKVTGFYVYNTGDLIPGWEKGEEPFIQYPGLVVYMLVGATSYRFNPGFSIKALTTQTEIQRKSCGSFIPSLSYSAYFINNTGDEVDRNIRQRSDSYNAVLNAGYYYTFVMSRKFYAGAGITPGLGISFTHLTRYLTEEPVKSNYFAPVVRFQERVGMGYNSRTFFAGADLSLTQWLRFEKTGEIGLSTTRTYIQVFFGYRFRAPAFIRKSTEKIGNLVPALNLTVPEPTEEEEP